MDRYDIAVQYRSYHAHHCARRGDLLFLTGSPGSLPEEINTSMLMVVRL
jgi:hypothetical protein